MTVCDYRHLQGPDPAVDIYRMPTTEPWGEKPNCEVALELDVAGFYNLLFDTICMYP